MKLLWQFSIILRLLLHGADTIIYSVLIATRIILKEQELIMAWKMSLP